MPGQEALIAALRDLTNGMAMQQQQNRQLFADQQANIQALLAAQQQGQLQQQLGNQDRLRTAATATVPIYNGRPDESLEEWLAVVNRVAVAKNWDDANKRRVAVSKLSGIAAQWHDQTGNNLVGWDLWQTQLVTTIEDIVAIHFLNYGLK